MTSAESTLIQQARRFDEAALAEIYDRYSPGVFRYAVRLLGDAASAEECVSDSFLRYLQALRADGGPQDHLQAYLYRIAHNWVVDFYRRQPQTAWPLEDDLPDNAPEPWQAAHQALQVEKVRDALLRLTPEQRQVVLLKYLAGWENESIARRLNKPVGAVKSLQHRALDALRRWLQPQQEEEVYGSRREG